MHYPTLRPSVGPKLAGDYSHKQITSVTSLYAHSQLHQLVSGAHSIAPGQKHAKPDGSVMLDWTLTTFSDFALMPRMGISQSLIVSFRSRAQDRGAQDLALRLCRNRPL